MTKDVVRPYLVLVHTSYDDDDGREALSVNTEGIYLEFVDGEPEDNSIGRNFSDVDRITELVKEAHKAGLEGRPLNIVDESVDWNDF